VVFQCQRAVEAAQDAVQDEGPAGVSRAVVHRLRGHVPCVVDELGAPNVKHLTYMVVDENEEEIGPCRYGGAAGYEDAEDMAKEFRKRGRVAEVMSVSRRDRARRFGDDG